jgi:hypothetical protein
MVDVQHPSRHIADLRIGELRHQLAHGVGAVHGIGVREHDNLAACPLDQLIQSRGFTAAGLLTEEADARLGLRRCRST